ncbi:MarR family winged helix-turn-helix transcriptional regulator [Chloroflexota bacterium]
MVKINTKLMDFNIRDISEKSFISLLQTADAINRYADIIYYSKGLSQIKYVVLHVLSINGGTMRPSDLAKWTFRERHDMTTLIRRLEKQELVRIQRSTIDRREVNVILTDKGWQVIEEIEPISDEITGKVMASVQDEEAETLDRLIQILRHNTEQCLEDINKTR